jgi:hypothetical protein
MLPRQVVIFLEVSKQFFRHSTQDHGCKSLDNDDGDGLQSSISEPKQEQYLLKPRLLDGSDQPRSRHS